MREKDCFYRRKWWIEIPEEIESFEFVAHYMSGRNEPVFYPINCEVDPDVIFEKCEEWDREAVRIRDGIRLRGSRYLRDFVVTMDLEDRPYGKAIKDLSESFNKALDHMESILNDTVDVMVELSRSNEGYRHDDAERRARDLGRKVAAFARLRHHFHIRDNDDMDRWHEMRKIERGELDS